MTYEEFLAIARRYEGETLETVTRRRYDRIGLLIAASAGRTSARSA